MVITYAADSSRHEGEHGGSRKVGDGLEGCCFASQKRREVLREEKGTKRIDLESGKGFSIVNLERRLLGMKDARDAEGEA